MNLITIKWPDASQVAYTYLILTHDSEYGYFTNFAFGTGPGWIGWPHCPSWPKNRRKIFVTQKTWKKTKNKCDKFLLVKKFMFKRKLVDFVALFGTPKELIINAFEKFT